MVKRTSGAFVAVVVACCATVGGREAHALPTEGFWKEAAPLVGLKANGYVERYPTPRGGLLAQVAKSYRSDSNCTRFNKFKEDCDWHVTLRPPTCTDTHLGRECNKARDEFIDFFWNGSSQQWRADAAIHMFRAFRKKLDGTAGYQECNLEASGVYTSDKGKYRARLSDDLDFDAPGPKVLSKDEVLKKEQAMLKNLANDIEKDPSLQAYVKGMWRQTQTSTPAFTCWFNGTPHAANYMADGEIQLSERPEVFESKELPLGETLLSPCEVGQTTGLCGRDILVHGLYVWDLNHGGRGGKLELHPIHAMVTEQKTDFSSEVKFAVFADHGKAGSKGGGWLAGFIKDDTPANGDWFTLSAGASTLPPKPTGTFRSRCDFKWTTVYPWNGPSAARFKTSDPYLIEPGKETDCTDTPLPYDFTVYPSRYMFDLGEDTIGHWAPGFVTGRIQRRWERVDYSVTHDAPVISDKGVAPGGKNRLYHITLRSVVRGPIGMTGSFHHVLHLADGSRNLDPSPISSINGGDYKIDGKFLWLGTTSEWDQLVPLKGYELEAEVEHRDPGQKTIGQTHIELPRPSVSIGVTKRTWKTIATNTPSPACPKYGIAANSRIEHQATVVATPKGFLPGNTTYEWASRDKPAAFQNVATTTASATFNFGNFTGEKLVRVVAKDGAAGGPIESATSTTELHSPDDESALGTSAKTTGPRSNPVPASSVLPTFAMGVCNKTNPYIVTTQPMTRLKAEWAFADLGYRDTKGQSLSEPFCPQFTWLGLETRILPDGPWTTVLLRATQPAGGAGGAWVTVHGWEEPPLAPTTPQGQSNDA